MLSVKYFPGFSFSIKHSIDNQIAGHFAFYEKVCERISNLRLAPQTRNCSGRDNDQKSQTFAKCKKINSVCFKIFDFYHSIFTEIFARICA